MEILMGNVIKYDDKILNLYSLTISIQFANYINMSTVCKNKYNIK